ncbi:lysozyme inhibitor LprI family protein [Aliarcobacter cryaerophilus]|uniref:lysozyme inhibitor LprI family protein n=1 Tax=Aliarcobacter cryaerophilus TaxID=28198 RepID=UPI0021B3A03F|nr:lysozyme inhibitor LprI family protein [Aliarcobacter cryaerophilus]MCT7464818.1 DUF1311 domain-containing protein [Aliarcobacter cryaerophilus]MCT7540203.1 DUF1311 domain-containing protein [Aliarcobacter cryaerophilus]MCT7544668.1 DUF1311 domain-containing protein [Aliarcobacter cryaerophilus]
MKLKIFILAILGNLVLSSTSFAFEQKTVEELKKLSDFKTVDEFVNYQNNYTQECLDNGFGGSGSIPCFVSYKLWDRELNIYYKKFFNLLNKREQEYLKKLQTKWLETRDLTMEYNNMLVSEEYSDEGSMYELLAAGHLDKLNTPMVKERALLLKSWYEMTKK